MLYVCESLILLLFLGYKILLIRARYFTSFSSVSFSKINLLQLLCSVYIFNFKFIVNNFS